MRRPFVLINMAATVDGKITSAAREYPRFTSPADRRRMDRLRAGADAILVGAGTARADDPTWHVRDEEMRRLRADLGKPPGLLRVLLSSSADVPPASRFFEDEPGGARVVATVDEAPAERVAALAGKAEVWRCGHARVRIAELLQRLAQRGVERLLVEGGGEVNWQFVDGGWVDELFVTVAPRLLGGRDAPTLLEGAGRAMARQVRLSLVELEREGDELYCRYAVER